MRKLNNQGYFTFEKGAVCNEISIFKEKMAYVACNIISNYNQTKSKDLEQLPCAEITPIPLQPEDNYTG